MKVHIHHVSESFVQIGGDISIFDEINERYTYYAKDYIFNPKYKMGIWDGKIRLCQSRTRMVPKGLVPDIIDYCVQQGYQISLDPEFSRFREEYPFHDDIWEMPFELYDYQERAISIALKKKRQLILSATSSGKSAIIYGMVRSLPGRTLVIVPSSNLVTQLGRKDFNEYSQGVAWDPEQEVHLVYDGASRKTKKNIIISTWQSLQHEKDPEYFASFDNVIVDEVHKAKATEIKRIIEACVNAFVRIGLTGSLDKSTANIKLLTGLFGPVVRVSSTAELMKRGIVSQMHIKALVLKYPDEVAKELRGIPYTEEVKFMETSTRRMKFMTSLVKVLKGNTLILVNHINKHGKLIYEQLVQDHPDKQIHWINKDVKTDDRDEIKELMESTPEGVIVIASYALFSTGISIKNLHNVVYGSSMKSLTTILQSIGRGLRLHDSKEYFTLYDIVDDLRGTRKSPNHMYKHFKERLEIYLSEQFHVTINEVNV